MYRIEEGRSGYLELNHSNGKEIKEYNQNLFNKILKKSEVEGNTTIAWEELVKELFERVQDQAKIFFEKVQKAALSGRTKIDNISGIEEDITSQWGELENRFKVLKNFLEKKYGLIFSNIQDDCEFPTFTVSWEKNNQKIYRSFKMPKPERQVNAFCSKARTLAEQDTFQDVTLNFHHGDVKTNKFFLSMVSPFFASMFQTAMKEKNTSVVDLSYLNMETFNLCMDFICGEDIEARLSKVDFNQINDFLYFAKQLWPEDRLSYVEWILLKRFDFNISENDFQILQSIAEIYNFDTLAKSLELRSHYSEIEENTEPPQKKVCVREENSN